MADYSPTDVSALLAEGSIQLVVFYCRSGGRSAMATEAFTQAGYDAHNMAGGMLAWASAGLPIAPDGGIVAEP